MFVRPFATATQWTTRLIAFALLFALGSVAIAQESKPSADDLEFFEKQVRPLLAEHCYSCHSSTAKKLQAGLRVDSFPEE
jgi:hypothetical protein